MPMEKTMCELFAGVGGFRVGMERLGTGWNTTWFSQWEPDKVNQWAHDCYVGHFGDLQDMRGEYHTGEDISLMDKNAIPDHNLLVGGFPCQDYSVAHTLASAHGIEGKKGVLWWQIRDTIIAKKPAFCIFENVDRLLKSPASQRGRDFGIILACLAGLNYSAEWRVVNAASYGAAQRRRRTFIFAYRNDTAYGRNMKEVTPSDVISQRGFMVQAFPIVSNTDIVNGTLGAYATDGDIIRISDNFAFAFDKAGYMHDGKIYTCDITENEIQPILIRQILQENAEEEFYISEDKMPKWVYLKGAKKIPRKTKDGHEYTFSEGPVAFPDPWDRPGRTMLTSESTLNRSTHVVTDPGSGRLRLLTPIEAERLQGFDDDWTNSGMPKRMRYFCMGNALVVPMITRMGEVLDVIMENEPSKGEEMPLSYEYDKHDRRDILRHAKALEGYAVGDVYELEEHGKHREDILQYYAEKCIQGWTDDEGVFHRGDKGRIGFLVQEVYFDEPRDNEAQADLGAVGVELKVSPLIYKTRAGLKVKERLVLGMINRNGHLPERFCDSHIYNKCKLMMLVYYIDETNQGKTPFQFPFYKSAYVKIPEVDMAMIEQDYRYIRDCVNEGRYSDLHEREAHYLSPCTKNGGRAFSFKPSYMNQLFNEYIDANNLLYDPDKDEETYDIIRQYDAIISDADELRGHTFEEIVLNRFKPYIGMTVTEIRQSLMEPDDFEQWSSRKTIDKAEFARTTFAMLGITSGQAEEFVRSNTYVKTLRVNSDLTMNEDISFSAFEFKELMEESWEESTVYEEMVDRQFLWSVFKEKGDDFVFHGARFWSLPQEDEHLIHEGWDDIRDIIRKGVKFVKDQKEDGSLILTKRGKSRMLNNFPDSKNTNPKRKEYRLCKSPKAYNKIISIRPHASLVYYDLKSIGYADTENPRSNGSELPNGDIMTKQCFWFNNEYILAQIQDMFEE